MDGFPKGPVKEHLEGPIGAPAGPWEPLQARGSLWGPLGAPLGAHLGVPLVGGTDLLTTTTFYVPYAPLGYSIDRREASHGVTHVL